MKKIYCLIFLSGMVLASGAQSEINPKIKPDKDKQFVTTELDRNFTTYKKVARDIWSYAELGFYESKSTTELQDLLRNNGFTVDAGVSGMPTAFVATYGSGGPVIGILAEFDALPVFRKTVCPEKNHCSRERQVTPADIIYLVPLHRQRR